MSVPDLNPTFGALLIGVFCSAALFGVTCTQVFYYFQNYDTDGLLSKATVASLLILEALHSAFGMHAIYYYTILNYDNPAALFGKAIWSATMTLGISAIIIFVVHLFYIRRIYYLSKKNIPLVALTTAFATGHCGISIGATVRIFNLESFADFGGVLRFSVISIVLALATDVIIAGFLSFYLHASKSDVGSTNTVINRMLVYTINNGILTSASNIIVLAFVVTDFNLSSLIFWGIFLVVGNLYTNSMMATLNSRKSMHNANRTTVIGALNHSVSSYKLNRTNGSSRPEYDHTEESTLEPDKGNKASFIYVTDTPGPYLWWELGYNDYNHDHKGSPHGLIS